MRRLTIAFAVVAVSSCSSPSPDDAGSTAGGAAGGSANDAGSTAGGTAGGSVNDAGSTAGGTAGGTGGGVIAGGTAGSVAGSGEDAGRDAGEPDGGMDRDGGVCAVDQITAESELLYNCTVNGLRRPAQGLCPPGEFPVRDFECNPALPSDGGPSCSCRAWPILLDADAGFSTDDGRCVPECSCSRTCATGRCVVRQILWGSDTPTRSLGLCL